MLTIFTIPKPFIDPHIKTIQTNAIKSWLKLDPVPEIFLFGNDEGVAEAAADLKVKHIKDIAVNESGTPYLDFIFDYVEKNAKYENLCYVNCDIVLFQDIIDVIDKINFKKYLIIGQRWDMDLKEYINFDEERWRNKLLDTLDKNGKLHEPAGSDYFLYKKGSGINMPPFLVGRAGWDNWLIYRFRKTGIPVLDCSKTIGIIHQNHNYAHIKSGAGAGYCGAESDYNINIIKNINGGQFCIDDSDYKFDGAIKKVRFNPGKIKFQFYAFHPMFYKFILFVKYEVICILPELLEKDFIDNKLRLMDDKNEGRIFLENYHINNLEYKLVNNNLKRNMRKILIRDRKSVV